VPREKKDWTADDPILKSPHAPHEVPAVLRLHKAGWPGGEIMQALDVRASKLVASLAEATNEEKRAAQANRPIHDALVKEGTE